MIKRIFDKLKQKFRIYQTNKLLSLDRTDVKTIRCGNDYGGFDVASGYADKTSQSRNLIVYSFGIGEDLSFSEDVLKKWNSDIYAFDPTPKSVKYVRQHHLSANKQFHFFPFGLSDKDGSGFFHLPKNEIMSQGLF